MPGSLTLGQIVARLGGRVAGDAGTLIRQVGSLDGAGAGQISFLTGKKMTGTPAATQSSTSFIDVNRATLASIPSVAANAVLNGQLPCPS